MKEYINVVCVVILKLLWIAVTSYGIWKCLCCYRSLRWKKETWFFSPQKHPEFKKWVLSHCMKENLGFRDASVDRGTCLQSWQPEIDPWILQGGLREQVPVRYSWSSTFIMAGMRLHSSVHRHSLFLSSLLLSPSFSLPSPSLPPPSHTQLISKLKKQNYIKRRLGKTHD